MAHIDISNFTYKDMYRIILTGAELMHPAAFALSVASRACRLQGNVRPVA